MLSEQELRKRLQDALDFAGNPYTVEEVAQNVKTGAMQAFHNDQAFVVTQVEIVGKLKILNVFAVCGELAHVMSLQPDIEGFAKAQECSALTAHGRKGWGAYLPQFGWKPHSVLWVHELSEG